MYAFVKVNLPDFDDQLFALDLLETKHVLIAPGSSFNVEYKDHFRITLLPPLGELVQVICTTATLHDNTVHLIVRHGHGTVC